jgi:protein-S-isoprenylcysteine O-methyltransferase Ste14
LHSTTPLIVLALGWIAYFLLHSLLASLMVKHWVERHHPGWLPAYRLFFNAVAVILMLPLVWLTYRIDAAPLWQWSGVMGWLANGLAILAIAGFLWTLHYYDSGEFIGARQLQERETHVEDQEHLLISPVHRYVRHPWYFFALVLMWSRDMNAPLLITVSMASLYFLFGSRLEERKLLHCYGAAYARFQQRVPGLIPLPWRHLSPDDAAELEHLACEQQKGKGAVQK